MQDEQGKKGFLGRVAGGMTSVAGIATAIATITTSVSAVLGVLVHHQAAQLTHADAKVSAQAQTIQQLRSHTRAVSSPGPTSNGAPAVGSATRYLSNLTPTVDNENVQDGQQVISTQPYPNSIAFGCNGPAGDGQAAEAYNVAGSSAFTAEVGIADDTQYVTGVIATVTFTNESGQQLGQPVQVSLGHPVSVKLNVTGVTQLGMTCAGRNQHTNQTYNGFDVVLANAGIS